MIKRKTTSSLFHNPVLRVYKRSLSYSGSVLWNSLPLEVQQLTSPNLFKGKLRDKFRFISNLISDMLFLYTASLKSSRGGSRIFLGGGALVSCSTSTLINQNTSCIRKPQVISVRGGYAPPAPSP